jgi:ABC-type phosphate transport system auxiliary subunit
VTRVALTILLPLLLPTILYVLWAAAAGRRQPVGTSALGQGVPWLWLAAGGIILAAIMLIIVNVGVGAPEGTYVPPHVVDGQVVPGHVLPGHVVPGHVVPGHGVPKDGRP